MKNTRQTLTLASLGFAMVAGCSTPQPTDAGTDTPRDTVDAMADHPDVTMSIDAEDTVSIDVIDTAIDTPDAGLSEDADAAPPADVTPMETSVPDAGTPDAGPRDSGSPCGNGVPDPGEQCDDGNQIEGDACDTNCTFPACGNRIIDPGEVCFGPSTDFPAAAGATAIAIADFNGDTFPDLAIANAASNNVSLLVNDGRGGFTAPRNAAVGMSPVSIAAADVNRDTRPDILVATNTGTTTQGFLGYLANNGNGTFATARTFPASLNTQHITTGDLNRDGLPDAIVSNYGNDRLSVFLGDPTNVFRLASSPAVRGASSASIADLNGDTRLDVAAAATTVSEVALYLGDGLGGLTATTSAPSFSAPGTVRAVDLDRDGDSDIVVANFAHTFFSVLTNNGSGTFQTRTVQLGSMQNSVAVADLSTDGWNDLAFASAANNTVYVVESDKMGGYVAPTPFPAPAGVSDVGLADLNRDGALDMAAPCSGAGNVRVWLAAP